MKFNLIQAFIHAYVVVTLKNEDQIKHEGNVSPIVSLRGNSQMLKGSLLDSRCRGVAEIQAHSSLHTS